MRLPAVAGSFYPAQKEALRQAINTYISEANPVSRTAKALVVPHAGYIYSGPIAGQAYRALTQLSPAPKRVVLLGPCHHLPVQSLALPESSSFATPLCQTPIDQQAYEKLAKLPFVDINKEAHAHEHSLEVQLPFLQSTLASFSLLPLVVGRASSEEICQVLELVIDNSTLIVVSTDLSHYLPYDLACQIDRETVKAILQGNRELVVGNRACGAYPLKGLMSFAQKKGWTAELLDLRNSGDTAGDKDRVVGYGAFIYHEQGFNE